MNENIWVVKRLRDLRSGKPETDIKIFAVEANARKYIAQFGFYPWGTEEGTEGDDVFIWSDVPDDEEKYPSEYIELESHAPPDDRVPMETDVIG